MTWSVDSETGVLRDVLLCPPDHYQWIPTNSIARDTLASDKRIDHQRLQAQYRELEDALDHAGVTRHYIEPEAHLKYQVYTRDSSQTTPWGPVMTTLAMPQRRGEYASILKFYGERGGFWNYGTRGTVEGGDIHIIRDGLLVVGHSAAAPTARAPSSSANGSPRRAGKSASKASPSTSCISTCCSAWRPMASPSPASRFSATSSPIG